MGRDFTNAKQTLKVSASARRYTAITKKHLAHEAKWSGLVPNLGLFLFFWGGLVCCTGSYSTRMHYAVGDKIRVALAVDIALSLAQT